VGEAGNIQWSLLVLLMSFLISFCIGNWINLVFFKLILKKLIYFEFLICNKNLKKK
jgi:hypothetical protein